MGNPFGYLMSDANPSVTTGVISALHRDFSPNPKQPEMLYQNMIQTDAAINPGNSGGALANILGEIIGINTFIVSPGGGSVGIGFAIPIDKAKKVASELIRYGKRLSYQTGIKVQDLTPAIAAGLGLDRETNGAVITAVEKPSPADLAGFRARDIIIGINNKTVHSTEDIQATFTEFFANDKVYLIILRGKQKLKIPLVLEPREEPKRRR
jgi:serine protease Do